MVRRELILWQPGRTGSIGLPLASTLLIVLVAYLHVFTGLDFEFYVFFAPPLALAAWYLGLKSALAMTLLVVGFWFWGDNLLEEAAVELLPTLFNTFGRLAVLCSGVWLVAQLRQVLLREGRLAREDGLTHLPNRRAFYEYGRQALVQAQREGTAMTAVFIDLDKFKEVNDVKGHAEGDLLLFAVADELAKRLRTSDIAARLGGDEFALLLPGMGNDAARDYVDDLQQRLLKAMKAGAWPVTFSIGVASYAQAPADFNELLAAADALMYEAKNAGRNRVRQRELSAVQRARE